MAHLNFRPIALGLAVVALVGAASAYASAAAPAQTGVRTALAAPPPKSPSPSPSKPSPPPPTPSGSKPPSPTPPPPTPSPSPSKPLEAATVCSYQGTIVACHDPNYGWWNTTDNCYWNEMVSQPPAGDPLWLGNSSAGGGKLYNTTCETQQGLGIGVLGQAIEFSSEPPPGYNGLEGDVYQVAALQAIVTVGLLPPIVNVAPKLATGGLVGLPVWLWQTKTPLAWGPVTVGVTVPPISLLGIPITPSLGVSVSALGAKIDWYMGDGHDVQCGIGTPYTGAAGQTTSPNCGYVFPRPGTYGIIAASTWNVSWTAGPSAGSLTIVRHTAPLPMKISELQVVVE